MNCYETKQLTVYNYVYWTYQLHTEGRTDSTELKDKRDLRQSREEQFSCHSFINDRPLIL